MFLAGEQSQKAALIKPSKQSSSSCHAINMDASDGRIEGAQGCKLQEATRGDPYRGHAVELCVPLARVPVGKTRSWQTKLSRMYRLVLIEPKTIDTASHHQTGRIAILVKREKLITTGIL